MELIVDFPKKPLWSSFAENAYGAARRGKRRQARDDEDRSAADDGDCLWAAEDVEDLEGEDWACEPPPPRILMDDYDEEDDDDVDNMVEKTHAAGGLIVGFPSSASVSETDSETDSKIDPVSISAVSAAAAAVPRRVTFSPSDQVSTVENYARHHNDKSALWYDESDLDRFLRERAHDVAQIKMLQRFGNNYGNAKGGMAKMMARYARTRMERELEGGVATSMGLESFVGSYSFDERTALMEAHRLAVLEEQWKQRLLLGCEEVGGGCEEERASALDPEAIANASRRKSGRVGTRAGSIGALHAKSSHRSEEGDTCLPITPSGAGGTIPLDAHDGPSMLTPPSA